jgi:hypothetical protein
MTIRLRHHPCNDPPEGMLEARRTQANLPTQLQEPDDEAPTIYYARITTAEHDGQNLDTGRPGRSANSSAGTLPTAFGISCTLLGPTLTSHEFVGGIPS